MNVRCAAFCGFAFATALFALDAALPAVTPEVKKAGAAIYDEKCYACHRWTRDFAGPAMGADVERYRKTPAALVAYLKDPKPIHPEKYKTKMTLEPLADKDAKNLAAWLLYLAEHPDSPDRPK